MFQLSLVGMAIAAFLGDLIPARTVRVRCAQMLTLRIQMAGALEPVMTGRA